MNNKVSDIFNNREPYPSIREAFEEQIAKGLIKYGTPVAPIHYSIEGWSKHLEGELIDGLVYNRMVLTKVGTIKEHALQARTIIEKYVSQGDDNDDLLKLQSLVENIIKEIG